MAFKIPIAQLSTFALLFTLALCAIASPYQAHQPATTAQKHSTATRESVAGIPRFAKATPNLYRGGQPDVNGLKTLKKRGIDIVVNMRGGRNEKEEALVERLGMQYVSIPWHCPFPSDKPFAKFLKLIRDNPEKKIFVHCRLGDDRTGMAVAAYRMSEEGWSADEAMREMKTFGFSPAHHVICPTLAHYEKSFPRRLKTHPAFKDLQPK